MIEKAKKSDYESICKLGEVINDNFKKIYPLESLFNKYTNILIYKTNNEIVGFLHYEILHETVNIVNIVVEYNQRRKSIASILLDNMLSELCNKNIEQIILEVNTENEAAINLYKKFNFRIIHTRKKYYQTGDAYIMERSGQ